jgi:hypothetical protein
MCLEVADETSELAVGDVWHNKVRFNGDANLVAGRVLLCQRNQLADLVSVCMRTHT